MLAAVPLGFALGNSPGSSTKMAAIRRASSRTTVPGADVDFDQSVAHHHRAVAFAMPSDSVGARTLSGNLDAVRRVKREAVPVSR